MTSRLSFALCIWGILHSRFVFYLGERGSISQSSNFDLLPHWHIFFFWSLDFNSSDCFKFSSSAETGELDDDDDDYKNGGKVVEAEGIEVNRDCELMFM